MVYVGRERKLSKVYIGCAKTMTKKRRLAGSSNQLCLQSRQPSCVQYHPTRFEKQSSFERAREGLVGESFAVMDRSEFSLRDDVDYDPIFAAQLVYSFISNCTPNIFSATCLKIFVMGIVHRKCRCLV